MPSHEEHCLHSLERYGVRGDDIHSWIDEPSQIAGGEHRKFRHDLKSMPIAIEIFGKKYGDEMVENIFLDHLKADSEEERKKNETPHYPHEYDAPSDPIPTSYPYSSIPSKISWRNLILLAIPLGIIIVLLYVFDLASQNPSLGWNQTSFRVAGVIIVAICGIILFYILKKKFSIPKAGL